MNPYKLAGSCAGIDGAVTICLGFEPDSVEVQNLTDALLPGVKWHKRMALAAVQGGVFSQQVTDSGTGGAKTIDKLAAGAGIAVYRGGERLTADAADILVPDPTPDKRDATGTPVTTFTRTGSKVGKFNTGVDTTQVGVGSRLVIGDAMSGKKQEYTIAGLTNDGDADGEVTLDRDPGSGAVLALTGMHTHVPAKKGTVTSAGFTLADITNLSETGELLVFVAEKFN